MHSNDPNKPKIQPQVDLDQELNADAQTALTDAGLMPGDGQVDIQSDIDEAITLDNAGGDFEVNPGEKEIELDVGEFQITDDKDDEPSPPEQLTEDTRTSYQEGLAAQALKNKAEEEDQANKAEAIDDEGQQEPEEPEDNPSEKKENTGEWFKQNITLTADMFSDVEMREGEFSLSLPSRLELDGADPIPNATEEEVEWDKIRVNGYDLRSPKNIFAEALTSGNWVQSVKFGNVVGKIRKGVLAPTPDKRMPMEDIALRIKSNMGTGGVIQVPLINSGFWLTITPPPEKTLNILFESIIQDKSSVGRDTFGAAFSNTSCMTHKRFLSMIIDSTSAWTINCEKEKLVNYIKRTDLLLLNWAFISAIYPKGHHYTRACTHDSNNCHATKEGKMNIFNMLVFDDDKITDDQRIHMSNLNDKGTPVAAVREYQKSIDDIDRRVVNVEIEGDEGDNKFTLCDGTATEWFKDGDIWYDDMHKLVLSTLGAIPDEERRDALMIRLSDAAELKAFTHIITSINTHYGFVDSPKGVRKALEAFSSSSEMREKLVKEIEKYVNDTARYVVGVENYICPACNKPQEQKERYIIPIDVVSSFFTVIATRLFK